MRIGARAMFTLTGALVGVMFMLLVIAAWDGSGRFLLVALVLAGAAVVAFLTGAGFAAAADRREAQR